MGAGWLTLSNNFRIPAKWDLPSRKLVCVCVCVSFLYIHFEHRSTPFGKKWEAIIPRWMLYNKRKFDSTKSRPRRGKEMTITTHTHTEATQRNERSCKYYTENALPSIVTSIRSFNVGHVLLLKILLYNSSTSRTQQYGSIIGSKPTTLDLSSRCGAGRRGLPRLPRRGPTPHRTTSRRRAAARVTPPPAPPPHPEPPLPPIPPCGPTRVRSSTTIWLRARSARGLPRCNMCACFNASNNARFSLLSSTDTCCYLMHIIYEVLRM